MDDSTWVELEFKESDFDKFKQVFSDHTYQGKFWDDILFHNETVEIRFDEMNYGGYSKMKECADMGLTFTGRHGNGGTYNSTVFASYCGDYHELEANYDSEPMVPVSKNGVNIGTLHIARRYFFVLNKISEYFKGQPEGLELEIGDISALPYT